jgi:hypothetical protein
MMGHVNRGSLLQLVQPPVVNAMSPRTKYHLLLWVAGPLGAAIAALPAYLISPWFVVGFFLWAFYVQLAVNDVRCPSCDNRVGFAKQSSWRLRHYFILPKNCEDCGADLSTKGQRREDMVDGDRSQLESGNK